MKTNEIPFTGLVVNGFLVLFLQLLALCAIVCCFLFGLIFLYVLGGMIIVCWFICLAGYMSIEPNEARVMVFFGKYKGTFTRTGFYWVNPFMSCRQVSLRARNLDIEPIKVNDKTGNPVLIGMVLVWKLSDTYKALFEIDSETMAASTAAGGNAGYGSVEGRMKAFENFVRVQSDAALRQVAGQYDYDDNNPDDTNLTLRSGGSEINDQLEQKLNERLDMAGIHVVEARINYLAYAPEIAAVMLRRQQATAIISAREKIVEGAVTMVQMALDKLEKDHVVQLDSQQKAAMVSNLLVVLCGDESAQPVVSTGGTN